MRSLISTVSILICCLCITACMGNSKGKARDTLWNGQDMSDWVFVLSDPAVDSAAIWEARDGGVLRIAGAPKGYLRTAGSFSDYLLHVEWRWAAEPGNGGILLHVQGEDKVWPRNLQAQLKTGHVGDLIAMEGAMVQEAAALPKNTIPPSVAAAEKSAGEWNIFEVVCRGNTMEFRVNGVALNRGTAATDSSGTIGLQIEGVPIEYRNIYIEYL